jgi:putative tryptophan/tyrosine transport system substrate-binding protein
MMRRREFIAGIVGLGSAAAMYPLAARSQPTRMRRIGMLSGFAASGGFELAYQTLFEALSQLGWERDRSIRFDLRFGAGDVERMGAIAKELVALQPDLLIGDGTPAAAALQRETRTIPIVFLTVGDPIGVGFVQSLRQPGGNMTGYGNVEVMHAGKLLSLLKSAAPAIKVAAAMYNPDTVPRRGLDHLPSFEAAAQALGIEQVRAEVHSDADIEEMIATLGSRQGGVVLIPDVFMNVHRQTVITQSIANKVPAIFDGARFAQDGGLLQYGADVTEKYRRTASFVDRILRGTRPSDLPVELPSKYRLVINLKTAKAIGLDLSSDVRSIADEIIE